VEVYRSGAIKIASLKDDTTQVVNGQRLKHYIARGSYNEDVDVIETVSLEEFIHSIPILENFLHTKLNTILLATLV
jgi:hypothetical protein